MARVRKEDVSLGGEGGASICAVSDNDCTEQINVWQREESISIINPGLLGFLSPPPVPEAAKGAVSIPMLAGLQWAFARVDPCQPLVPWLAPES